MLYLATTVTNSGSWRPTLLPSFIVMDMFMTQAQTRSAKAFWASCNSSFTIHSYILIVNTYQPVGALVKSEFWRAVKYEIDIKLYIAYIYIA